VYNDRFFNQLIQEQLPTKTTLGATTAEFTSRSSTGQGLHLEWSYNDNGIQELQEFGSSVYW
jgi:hypothetical protein